jgi:hypothetical protein
MPVHVVFALSFLQIPVARHYIENQPEPHCACLFHKEFRELLRRQRIRFDDVHRRAQSPPDQTDFSIA